MANTKAEKQDTSTSFSTLLIVFFAFSGLFSYMSSDLSNSAKAICALVCTMLLNAVVVYEREKKAKPVQNS